MGWASWWGRANSGKKRKNNEFKSWISRSKIEKNYSQRSEFINPFNLPQMVSLINSACPLTFSLQLMRIWSRSKHVLFMILINFVDVTLASTEQTPPSAHKFIFQNLDPTQSTHWMPSKNVTKNLWLLRHRISDFDRST